MIKKNTLSSKKLQEVRKKRRSRFSDYFIIYFVIFVILIIFLGYLSQLERINITKVEISGNKIIEKEELIKFINNKLSGNYFLFFPKSNVFFYPKNEIKEELTNNYKTIQHISIKLSKNTLLASISERTQKYLWCGTSPIKSKGYSNMENNQEECYFSDETGYIFARAPTFSGNVYFKFYGSLFFNGSSCNIRKCSNPIGFYLPEFIKKFDHFKSSLEEINVKPVALLFKDDNEIEVYLSSKKDLLNSPKLILKQDADLAKITNSLKSILLEENSFKLDYEKKYDSLLYIDLRFNNKVFPKFKKK